MTVTTVNPANGETLATYEETLPDAVDAIHQRACEAAGTWRQTPPTERALGFAGGRPRCGLAARSWR